MFPDCGNFFIPDNGFVSTNSTVYNTTVEFFCDEGFEISGNSSMYCEHTAVWSTSPPVCILVGKYGYGRITVFVYSCVHDFAEEIYWETIIGSG